MSVLDSEGRLVSDLWLDQPDAEERVAQRLRKGDFDSPTAEALVDFVRSGFLRVHLDEPELIRQIEEDVDRIWEQRPANLAFAYGGPPTSMAHSRESEQRRPGYRIPDLHSHSPGALSFYLHPELYRWASLLFDAPAVAIQSLYFQWGSQQSLHRDPVYVKTNPPSHLLGCWIALEDISPESGPLSYVPGSHKLPYYQFSPGRITIKPGEDYLPAYEYTRRQMEAERLREEALCCRAGDAFFWHASLVHGGHSIQDESATRRSFVMHYSRADAYHHRGGSFRWEQGGQEQHYHNLTSRLLVRGEARGLDNPLRDFDPGSPRQPLLRRILNYFRKP